MTRVIKFRAWDEERERMVFFCPLEVQWFYEDDYRISGYEDTDTFSGRGGIRHDDFLGDEPEVKIMQFSGSQDQKGKEIYDGDIAWVTHMLVENIPTYKALVVWDKYRFALKNLGPNKDNFMFSYQNLDPFGLNIEVIGNIYQNPELLNG